MKAAARALAASAAISVAACGQSAWQLEGNGPRARAVGPSRSMVEAGEVRMLDPGAYRVHFAATASGKPGSLRLAAPVGSAVVLGVARGEPDRGAPLALADEPQSCALGSAWRMQSGVGAAATARDRRLSVTAQRGARTDALALLARANGDGSCYAFVLDWGEAEARLERVLGGDRLVLRRAPLPDGAERAEVALQTDGFRLEGLLDDAPLVRCFDGAISEGACGVAWRGPRPALQDLAAGPPCEPLASAAVVQTARAATLHAWTPTPPGSLAVLELSLDRPHAWIPRSPGGFEPWLRQPLAAPVVAWGDWRGSLGARTVSEVDADGAVRMELRWPLLPALSGRIALARVCVATADGGAVIERSPPVRLTF